MTAHQDPLHSPGPFTPPDTRAKRRHAHRAVDSLLVRASQDSHGPNVLWELKQQSQTDVGFHSGANIAMLSQWDAVRICRPSARARAGMRLRATIPSAPAAAR